MAGNAQKKEKKRAGLSLGYSIWMAAGVFLLYFSAIIGAGILILLAVRLFLLYRKGQKKSGFYHETVVRPAVAEQFEEVDYEPKNGFSRETIFGLGILHRTHRYQSRHRIAGCYRGIPFEAAAVTLSYQRSPIGTNAMAALFDGLFMAFAWPREDPGMVRCISAAYKKALPQNPGPGSPLKTKQNGALKVYPLALSNAGFEEAFRVYAENPEQAAMLFSERFCSNVLKFSKRSAAPVVLCFYRDKLYVGLDLEQPVFDKPAADGEQELQKQAVRDRLNLIMDCIDLMVAPEFCATE